MAAKFLDNDDLSFAYNRSSKFLDSNSEAVITEMRRVFQRYINAVKAAIADGATESEKINAVEIDALTKDLRNYLIDAGFEDLLGEYKSSLARIGKQSLEYFELLTGDTQRLGGVSADTLNGLSRSFITDFGIEVERALIQPLEREIRRSFIAYEKRSEAVKEITKSINEGKVVRKDGKQFTKVNVEVLIADTQRQFQQAVVSEKAKELELDIFLYSGPLDQFTSEQCRFLLLNNPHGAAGFYRREDIKEKLHPALKGNPLITRGHPNCRHQWIPVTEEYAKRQGFRA